MVSRGERLRLRLGRRRRGKLRFSHSLQQSGSNPLIHNLGDIGVVLVEREARFMRVFFNLLLGTTNMARKAIMQRIVTNNLLRVSDYVSIMIRLAI